MYIKLLQRTAIAERIATTKFLALFLFDSVLLLEF